MKNWDIPRQKLEQCKREGKTKPSEMCPCTTVYKLVGELRRKDDSMKRQVFFSFHFGNDVWRVGQIRNIGTIEGQELFSDNGWEKVRLKSDPAIKAWIDKELDMRSCVVVALIGSETASRRWVQYEIEQAWNLVNEAAESAERGRELKYNYAVGAY